MHSGTRSFWVIIRLGVRNLNREEQNHKKLEIHLSINVGEVKRRVGEKVEMEEKGIMSCDTPRAGQRVKITVNKR